MIDYPINEPRSYLATDRMAHLTIEDVDRVTFPRVKEFYDYWSSLRTDERIPRWGDVDMMQITKLAPFIAVKDVIDGGQDFRNRFWGTGLVRAYDFDATGHSFSDYLDDESVVEGLALHRIVVETAEPKKSSGTMKFWKSKAYVSFEGIVCPLRRETDDVEMLISCYQINLGGE